LKSWSFPGFFFGGNGAVQLGIVNEELGIVNEELGIVNEEF
jgi:hypothetical protein